MIELLTLIIELVRLFVRSPSAKRQALMADVRGAFAKADAVDPSTGAPSDDTSAIEDLVNH